MIDYAIDTLNFTALLVVLTVLVRSVYAGYQMAQEWHEDGADLAVLAQVDEPWGTQQDTRFTFRLAILLGWRLYICVARWAMK